VVVFTIYMYVVFYLLNDWLEYIRKNICIILVVNLFIMYLFYLSRHIALIGYIFVIYCYWPKFTPVTCDLLNFGKIVVSRVHFLLTETIKRNNQGIIQNINVIVKRWSFCTLLSFIWTRETLYGRTWIEIPV
jgi:hypothetical protein